MYKYLAVKQTPCSHLVTLHSRNQVTADEKGCLADKIHYLTSGPQKVGDVMAESEHGSDPSPGQILTV
ncbi:hypothetical protein RRG08_042811 [Elysia crispata]|uniref:Uncharacterized protein n=1 Tax=Elysia crispata TaxID=231223 RepID=A0AAE0YCG7_9GAST|nr:hypothetical protein RRG08_042811 [Elysia crispata]